MGLEPKGLISGGAYKRNIFFYLQVDGPITRGGGGGGGVISLVLRYSKKRGVAYAAYSCQKWKKPDEIIKVANFQTAVTLLKRDISW